MLSTILKASITLKSMQATTTEMTDERGTILIKIAANDIESLRKSDVYRVLDDCPNNERYFLANWIKDYRPDLLEEIRDVLCELAIY